MEKETTPRTNLRQGWTTGACASAATKAALSALLGYSFPDPVTITLPKGQTPAFALAREHHGDGFAEAQIIKDAGDDPDVTHLAAITARVEFGAPDTGITFVAGSGVGTVTKPGLPIDVGEPAINPVPRAMMIGIVNELCSTAGVMPDIIITISVADGQNLARRTWNSRLGIVGGLSILGTTGIVNPFSCSAWIHSIHRGIDVSRATGVKHVLGATGSTSEAVAQSIHNFPDCAILDMGDFIGGLLKYLRKNPIPKLTLAGGFGKFTKLAQGAIDLHSGRSQVDMDWLAQKTTELVADKNLIAQIKNANTAMQVLESTQSAGIDLPKLIAGECTKKVKTILRDAPVEVEIMIISRTGQMLARNKPFM